MKTCWLMSRVLGSMDRKTRIVIPVKAFTDEATAQEACRLRTEAINQLMSARLFDPEEGDLGISLGYFVRELGIASFQHIVDGIDVHEGDLVGPPPPSILIP